MANKIQVKRGKESNLPILDVGEPAFTTDTKKPFIGSDSGNIELATKEQINDLEVDSKVDIRNARKPLVTFTWDDGRLEEWQVKDIFASKGVPYVIAQVAGQVGKTGYLSWEQLNTLQNDYGCEIASHTMSHLYDLTSQTDSVIDYELGESYRILNTNGIKCQTICIPHGVYNTKVMEIAKKYYKAMRVSIEGINFPPIATFQLTEQLFMENTEAEKNTLDYLKQCVDTAIANKTWLIILGHGYTTMANPQHQTDLALLIDYIKSKNVEITTMSKALNYFGNIIQSGNVKEQFYQKQKHLPHFAVGADGAVSSNYINTKYLGVDTLNSITPITSFEQECISIMRVTSGNKAGFPFNSAGMLYTYRFSDDVNYSFQEYFIYGSTERWTRKIKVDGTWDEWRSETVRILSLDSVNSTMPPSKFSTNRIMYVNISSGNKAGFPGNAAGTLEINTTSIANNWGYVYQIYHCYATGSIYKRVAISADVWDSWITIYRPIGNIPTNGVTPTTPPNGYTTGAISRNLIDGTNNTGFPDNSSGLLETNTFGAFSDYNYCYQTYHVYGSNKFFKRSATSATTWGDWINLSL